MPTRPPALDRLCADDLKRAIVAYRDLLRAHQERLNRLNVYPVPDGDTGTNMALTLEAVVTELEQATDMPSTCTAISHGSLMGARGNSGVILSQVLRGIADGCKAADDAGPVELAAAFTAAADAAYGAVMRPVEGTILTVARAAADGANGAERAALCALLDAARTAAQDALDRTPEMLPVLKQAGVVDAGGAGLVLLLDAFLHVADGRDLPAAPEVPIAAAPVGTPADGEDNLANLKYEVMYLLEAPDDSIPELKRVWMGIGDSIVVVGGDGLWNCHIHTNDAGAAIEAALDCGRPRNIRITDLLDQVEEERWVRDAGVGRAGDDEDDAGPVSTAVVAVATGDGISRIFRSLGARRMIAGGQSMNPSTAQILEAVDAAPANEVVVLPNNKNIVAVAEQVHELTAKTVRVVPTHSVTEGFAALLSYDPEATADENAAVMREAADRIVSGEVTRAVRATSSDAGPIAEGDWLGLSRDGIEVVRPSLADAACALLERLVRDDHEIVTVIEGDGASAADTRRVTEWLAEHRPGASAEVHHGGQPLYPYLLSIE